MLNRLVLVDPDSSDVTAHADAVERIAEALELLPARPGSVANLDGGLRPFDHVRLNPWSGTANAVAPPVALTFLEGPDGLRTEGTVTFGPAYEGPPGHVHGGCVAGVFDELLGRSQVVAGFTGTLTVAYRRPTPLLRELELAAWVDRVDGRKRWVKGTCSLEGVLLAEAEGLFIAPRDGATLEGITAMLNRR